MTQQTQGTTCYKIETWANPACGIREPDFISGDWEYVDCPDCLDQRPVVRQERRSPTPIASPSPPASRSEPSSRNLESMSFRQGVVFGAGFTLGAFLISIPIWLLVLVLFLVGVFAAQ